jgi:hypothetical protein
VDYRVEYTDAYYDSVSMLDDSPETRRAQDFLLYEATNYPERNLPLTNMFMRVVKTDGRGGFRPLRLCYFIEDGCVYIMHIEPHDELAL